LIITISEKIVYIENKWGLGIGDWGLGIGDRAQSPIPKPQSPFLFSNYFIIFYDIYFI